ncbi:hypothetical protein BAE44_0018084 [Dichanthelium oligosanthes]|uniref:Knottin scorpion toxin-like domain-containing protein n=1 Tax=Dichanthelium oligosanthes TaxID=888268 RepID=A0A1E5V6V3_9POAL|nr:hypothetical protein BAE44_0018084 [Dichanthelium oligosanthes]
MARAGAVVALIMLAFLVASAASFNPMCCNEYRPWGDGNNLGCSPNQNGACDTWCQQWCRGGVCTFRSGYYKCHCYC